VNRIFGLLVLFQLFALTISPIAAGRATAVNAEVWKALSDHLPGFVLVGEADYSRGFLDELGITKEDLSPVLSGDVDGDGDQDYLLSVVNHRSAITAFYLLLRDKDAFEPVLISESRFSLGRKPSVCQVMQLKKPGARGLSSREHFAGAEPEDPKRSERAEYRKSGAVEISLPIGGLKNPCENVVEYFHCASGYSVDAGRIKETRVCN
jgi:hypothetical protein